MSRLGSAVVSVTADMKPLAQATTAAGAVIGAGFIAALDGAMDAETVRSRLMRQIGDPKVAKAAGEATGNAYKAGFGTSMADVGKTVEAVIASNLTGIDKSSNALDEMARKAMAVADTFGFDVTEAIGAAGVAIQTGLAKDGTQALDLIAAAAKKVPAQYRGELLAATEEYSKFFAGMGFSGEKTFGLLALYGEQGKYGLDKFGDSIKEVSLKLTGLDAQDTLSDLGINASKMATAVAAGGQQAQDALQKIASGLLTIKDPGERAAAAIDVFGTPLEDLGVHKIPEFLKILSSGEGGLEDFAGTASDMAKTMEGDTAQAVASLGREFKGVLSDAVASFLPQIKAVAGFLKDNKDVLEILVPVVGALAGAIGVVTAAQWLLNAAMAANPIGLVVIAVAALVAGLIVAYNKSETFRNIVNGAFRAVGDAATWLWDNALKPLWNGTKAAFTGMGDAISWWWNSIVKPVWGSVTDAFDAIGSGITALRATISDRISSIIGFFLNLRDRIGDRINDIRDRFFNLRDRVGESFQSIRSTAESAWNSVANTIRKPINWVITSVYDQGIRKLVNETAAKVGIGLRLPEIKALPTYHTGGPVPGDQEQVAMLLGGEHVLNRDQVKMAGGHDGVDRMFDTRKNAPKTGGLLDSIAGMVRGAIGPIVKATINSFIKPVVAKIPGTDSFPGNIAKGSIDQVINGVIKWFEDDDRKNAPKLMGRDSGTGSSVLLQAMANFVRTVAPGMRVSSGYRPGDPGYHGRQRAIDMGFSDRSEYRGGGQALAAANAIKSKFKSSTLELIWDFLGSNAVWNGQNHFFTGPGAGQGTHRDHIHWAFGGSAAQIQSGMFDNGGALLPGYTLAYNGTGRPETVLTDAQLQALTSRGRGRDGACMHVNVGGIEINVHGADKQTARRAGEEAADALLVRLGSAVQAR